MADMQDNYDKAHMWIGLERQDQNINSWSGMGFTGVG